MIRFIALALIASGKLWDNIKFANLSTYPVTFVTVLMVIVYLASIPDWMAGTKQTATRVALVSSVILLLGYELIVHGVASSLFASPSDPPVDRVEWFKSYALFVACAGIPVVTSRLRFEAIHVKSLCKILSIILIGMGLIGLVQVVLGNVWKIDPTILPGWLSAKDPTELDLVDRDAFRFNGFRRSVGISTEFSFYGIGMVMLLILISAFQSAVPGQSRLSFSKGAVLAGMVGVASSLSLSAWTLGAAYAAGWASREVIRFRNLINLILIFIAISVLLIAVWPYLANRFDSLEANMENRFWGSLQLIVMPAPRGDLFSSLLGAGLGHDDDLPRVQEVNEVVIVRFKQRKDLIVNGWAFVSVTMGYCGLLLNLLIVYLCTTHRANRRLPSLGLFLAAALYFFAVGRYLDPDWWAFLAIVSGLNSSRLAEDAANGVT